MTAPRPAQMPLTVVAWSLAWPLNVKRGTVNAKTTYDTEAEAREYADLCMEPDQLDRSPQPIELVPLVRQSDAEARISALTAALDEARADAERMRALLARTQGPLDLYHAYGWPDRDGVCEAVRAALLAPTEKD